MPHKPSSIAGHLPRKRFGQNFLHDRSVIDKIVRAINPQAGQHLVEIGPGLGALTAPLLKVAGELEAVEIDRDVIAILEQRCESQGKLTVHSGDVLKFDFRTLATRGEKLRLVGNLPYNISTPILFHLLSQAEVVQDMHFMLQKEVVERLTAMPNSKEYGRLSIMVQYRCQTHATQRRKTLRNALKNVVHDEQWQQLNINPTARPETLSVAEFVALSNGLHHASNPAT
ncbi:MAG: 16S rRNA (adenine1518-N6/adenine1519-N6)-dimethyltransferase [Halothiobacillaceae bacterium]|nr:MAG: 16S rRNA (adenine1518-N6/adenine1519-N6)-dimethyltransferase [Halothiobacillaceae bacterium]